MIPVDAELQSDRDAENEAIALKSAIYQVANGSSLGLVILDGCRNSVDMISRIRSLARKENPGITAGAKAWRLIVGHDESIIGRDNGRRPDTHHE